MRHCWVMGGVLSRHSGARTAVLCVYLLYEVYIGHAVQSVGHMVRLSSPTG